MARKVGFYLLIFMLVSLGTMGTVSADSKLKVMVNNSSVNYGVQIVSGQTMVPLKAFESFKNTSIQWEARTKQVTIVRDSMKISLLWVLERRGRTPNLYNWMHLLASWMEELRCR